MKYLLKNDRLEGRRQNKRWYAQKDLGERAVLQVPSLIRRRNRSPGQMSNGFFDLPAHASWPGAPQGVQVVRQFVRSVMR
jgi:hypothetical protein